MVRLGQGLESLHFPSIHLPTRCREAGGPHPAAPARQRVSRLSKERGLDSQPDHSDPVRHLSRRQSQHREGGKEKGGQCPLSRALNALGDTVEEGKDVRRPCSKSQTPTCPSWAWVSPSEQLPQTRLLPMPTWACPPPHPRSQGLFVLVI